MSEPMSKEELMGMFLDAAAEAERPPEWPDPSPLGDELPPVWALERDLLPQSFLPLVEDVSERMQTPFDYAAASAIVALAGCVNRRAIMQPKAEDTSWQVIPNLWGAIIAPPGLMKSPVQRQMTNPLAEIEKVWRANFEQEEQDYELEKERADLKWQAWKEKTKESYKKGTPEPAPPEQPQDPPAQQRLILTDATFEKLHEILAENSAGVLVFRDELTGWLGMLEKPGREGERGFYLQAWSGDTGFSVDRIGRGSIHVPAVCVSLLGNIQPARLRWYLSDAMAGGANDDGLFQRFQVIVWPDPPRDWTLIDRPPNQSAFSKADKVFSVLANLPADPPLHLRFDGDSQQLFFAWLAELEHKVRGENGLHPAMVAHLAKYRSLMPSLAALFELADRAADDGELTGTVTVSLEHTQQAEAWCVYLESHARRVYSCVVSPQCMAARELARHIQAGDVGNPFTSRDVYIKGWSGLDDSERADSAIKILEAAAWVRQEEACQPQGRGRPSERWQINPKVARREKKWLTRKPKPIFDVFVGTPPGENPIICPRETQIIEKTPRTEPTKTSKIPELAPRPSGATPEVSGGRPATCSPQGYTLDADGPGCTCQECGGHFGTVAGWRYHITGKRCTPAAD